MFDAVDETDMEEVMFWLEEVANCASILYANEESSRELNAELALFAAEEAAELQEEEEREALANAAAERALASEMAGKGDIEARI